MCIEVGQLFIFDTTSHLQNTSQYGELIITNKLDGLTKFEENKRELKQDGWNFKVSYLFDH